MNGYQPGEGAIWNPFLKYERNKPCPCDSGKKFKHCHLNQLPRTIALDDLKNAIALEQEKQRQDLTLKQRLNSES